MKILNYIFKRKTDIKMNQVIELSRLNPELSTNEIINFMLDNGYIAVQNDYAGKHEAFYRLDDLAICWPSLKRLIKIEENNGIR